MSKEGDCEWPGGAPPEACDGVLGGGAHEPCVHVSMKEVVEATRMGCCRRAGGALGSLKLET